MGRSVRAEILAVGSELLAPGRSETNAIEITEAFLSIGIEIVARSVVADDADALTAAFRTALARADIVIATGGLGPTEDDLTREAAASALGRALHRDASILEALKARFARFGRAMAPVNEKQADVVDGAVSLPNGNGTAPGQWVEADGRVLVLLPGPPKEMRLILDAEVLPRLRARAGGRVIRKRILRIAAMGESDVEQVVAPIYKTWSNPKTTILGGAGQTELHLVADGASPKEADGLIEGLASSIRAALPNRIFSEDGRELHEVVGALLLERHATVSVAESCTGGLLAKRLTDVAGSSAYFDRGVVAYSNAAKTELVGVDPNLLASVGAVSEEVARALAVGARERSGSTYGIGITGIAGPGGGTAEKPVGLVFLALAGPDDVRVRRAHFPGDRERVRMQACQSALEMLRRTLLGREPW